MIAWKILLAMFKKNYFLAYVSGIFHRKEKAIPRIENVDT